MKSKNSGSGRAGRGEPGRGSPKSGKRLPLPKKTGRALGTRKGAKGYTRAPSKAYIQEGFEDESVSGQFSYEVINHTADLGIVVSAPSLERLFESAGMAFFDLVTDIEKVKSAGRFSFSLTAENPEALLVAWLRELLYLFYGKKMAFRRLEVTELSECSLKVTCWGEKVNSKRHVLLTEIKAVTYHELQIKRDESGWTARVIFDI
jgi:SHS2 domain-containing protein